VEPFSGADYNKNSQGVGGDVWPCGICGKATDSTIKAKYWGEVYNGVGIPSNNVNGWILNNRSGDVPSMGRFPIGSECHREHVLEGLLLRRASALVK